MSKELGIAGHQDEQPDDESEVQNRLYIANSANQDQNITIRSLDTIIYDKDNKFRFILKKTFKFLKSNIVRTFCTSVILLAGMIILFIVVFYT
ncbi:unnamed protein product [Blepharisma stoltei]|uniref:Uncharacterized protein n=1 Tax=Blepharisma stoltei TaxID=1481888 RepID=A0AAU9KIE1_9CILI|nr:unnamed protein product [Blepharisma stoltei]